MLLSTILWLVGGGFAPIFISILASATATRINKPLDWLRQHLSPTVRDSLAKLWHWPVIGFVLLFLVSVEIAVFGYPLLWLLSAEVSYTIQTTLALISLGLMPVAMVTAFAHDLKPSSEQRVTQFKK
jgi:phosphoglycerol transferase MdoB-like AlkP superfamily enzyme